MNEDQSQNKSWFTIERIFLIVQFIVLTVGMGIGYGRMQIQIQEMREAFETHTSQNSSYVTKENAGIVNKFRDSEIQSLQDRLNRLEEMMTRRLDNIERKQDLILGRR